MLIMLILLQRARNGVCDRGGQRSVPHDSKGSARVRVPEWMA